MLLCPPSGLHLKPRAVAVRDLHEFPVTLAPSLCPESVLGSEDFRRLIVQKDDTKLSWLLTVNLSDVRRRVPYDVLSTKRFALEHEVIETPGVVVLISWLGSFPDGNLNRYREFLESRTVLIVCQSENGHRALLFLSGWIVSGA
jgi:hypothetical protein